MTALIPSRRRGKLATAAKAARNVALVRAGLSLAETRLAKKLPNLPGHSSRSGVTRKRVALVGGGLLVALGATVAKRRSGGDDRNAVVTQPGSTPPSSPMNYDASGPPANTATPRSAPDTTSPLGDIDEAAEIAAAAAEAGAIGGAVSDYASDEDPSLPADAAFAPLAESGEGEDEGFEQATAELVDNLAAPIGPGAGMTDAERQIQEAIDEQSNPSSGETPETRS